MDPIIGFQLAKLAHPKVAWDYLARLNVQSNAAKRYHMEWKIRITQQGDDSIHAFYVKMTALLDQLALMEPQFTSAGDLAIFEMYRQETMLVKFLMALRPEFEHVYSMLLHRSSLLSVDTAFLIYCPRNRQGPLLLQRGPLRYIMNSYLHLLLPNLAF